jgi:hypothetical protein
MAAPQDCAMLDVLGQNLKPNTMEFWHMLNSAISDSSQMTGRFTAKAKQQLTDIFRHSISSPDPQFTIQVVIALIRLFSRSMGFLDNFSHSDAVFYSTFTFFVSRVLSKPSDRPYVKLKTDLLIALDALYREPTTLREETAKGVLITIIPMLKNVNDIHNPVALALSFIHKLE